MRIRAAIAFCIGNDIASCRAISTRSNGVSVIGSRWNIVLNRDDKCVISAVTIAVGDHDVETVGSRVARCIIGELVTVAVGAVRYRYRQCARSTDHSSASSYVYIVNYKRCERVATGGYCNRAAGCLAI